MSSDKTTLLTNIFNEEYLLPFWLHHHKKMFDEIVILDYNSTDKSIEICESICPGCKIIKTRNKVFDCQENDKELMEIENSIDGIKIILNTTEFLFCEKPIKDIFGATRSSYAVNIICPYSANNCNIPNDSEFFSNLLNNDVVYHYRREGGRQLHNYPTGKYSIGRHEWFNNSIPTNKAHIVWFGYYPMNDHLMKRKLQITLSHRDKIMGRGFQHWFDKEKILSINKEKASSGTSLENINVSLYNLLKAEYEP